MELKIYPTIDGLISASRNGHLSVIDLFIRNKDLINSNNSTRIANVASANGYLYILKYLAEHYIFPDINGANEAAKEGHLKVLKWLSKYNILPDSKGAADAYNNGKNKVVAWLQERNIFSSR
jgi:ankyrin repeat protein